MAVKSFLVTLAAFLITFPVTKKQLLQLERYFILKLKI